MQPIAWINLKHFDCRASDKKKSKMEAWRQFTWMTMNSIVMERVVECATTRKQTEVRERENANMFDVSSRERELSNRQIEIDE